jgi:hypothetical protein
VSIRLRASFAVLAVLLLSGLPGINAQRSANSNAAYQQLRGLLPGTEVITVNNLELRRDAATFTFRSGSFAFYNEVNGKVTGAVFKGEGHLHITPPTVQERHNLSIVNHSEEFDEDFDKVVLRFTDSTAAELRKAASGKGEPDSAYAKEAEELQGFLRHHSTGTYMEEAHTLYYRKIDGNLDLRILTDVLSPAPGGFFYAAVHGHKYSHLFFQIDPQGVAGLAPEEVSLQNWDTFSITMTYPLAFYRAGEYANGSANGNQKNAAYRILSENLDVSIEKSGFLSSVATIELRAEQDGVAVIPLDLYPSLRVSKVETGKGEPLSFVQEEKDEDSDFGVVLAAPINKGETATLKVTYAGKDVVINEGRDNYYPVARENWFPNSVQGLGDYATYRMLFHVPKGLQLIATGTKVKENTDGGITTSEWKTEVPLTQVGFTFGDFATKETKFSLPKGGDLTVDGYANKQPTDEMFNFANSGVGSMNTTPMLATVLSQGVAAAQVYNNYFGELSFPHIALTQQSTCQYGQSWPMLVYLPICGFMDAAQRAGLITLYINDPQEVALFNMYITTVTPHEVAHQWWGHTVAMRSYRDEWMREGFADESATIYLQATNQMDQFLEFWKLQRRLITEKNAFGFRPNDVGPVTMGRRLSSPKAGYDIYQNLVYPKGAYILHMVRMMMWNPKDGDARFKDTMHDFVETHRLQPATTEDFKAAVERHMSQQMDLDGNHRMDWFFNQYVYGTDLPAYHFEGQATQNGDATSLHIKLIQSGVSDKFKMLVPLYLELTNGKIISLGSINITGNKTIDQTVQLGKLPAPVKRVSINYYYDVLSTEN